MRGWPETFPQPHIKAASCSPTKGSRPIQGLEVGGGAGARHCLPGHPEQGPRPQGQPLPTAHCGPRSPRSWALGNGLLQPPAGHPPCPHGPGAGSAPGPITHPGLWGEGCLGDTSHSCCYADPLPPPPRHTPRLASPPQARSSAPQPGLRWAHPVRFHAPHPQPTLHTGDSWGAWVRPDLSFLVCDPGQHWAGGGREPSRSAVEKCQVLGEPGWN